jgi:hypothetical protein
MRIAASTCGRRMLRARRPTSISGELMAGAVQASQRVANWPDESTADKPDGS